MRSLGYFHTNLVFMKPALFTVIVEQVQCLLAPVKRHSPVYKDIVYYFVFQSLRQQLGEDPDVDIMVSVMNYNTPKRSKYYTEISSVTDKTVLCGTEI